VVVVLALGCGGMSLDHVGSGGTAGAGDGATGGTGGKGSGATGGVGGTAGGVGGTTGGVGGTTGGVGATGGISTTGGVGGTTGGVGGTTGGVGGTGGISATCSLPLESGNCDAFFYRWGFDPVQDQCVSFIYGGCGGNANNFSTVQECQAACPSVAPEGCPPHQPLVSDVCTLEGATCLYSGFNGCLCVPASTPYCRQVDPSCTSLPPQRELPPAGAAGECSGSDCVEAVVIPTDWSCTCAGGHFRCDPQQ
jgi:hypothetical protein